MSFDLWEIIKNMLNSMLGDIVNSWLQQLQAALGNVIQTAFYIEKMPGLTANLFTTYTISSAVGVLYLTTVGLLTLKLCWKGWKVYVLGRDGDAEVSPTNILSNSLYALGVAVAFPVLYDIVVNIVIAICDHVLGKFPGANSDNFISTIIGICSPWLTGSNVTVFLVILMLIFVIVCVILAIQMIFRGVEMFIYRLGVPLAVIGLIDSDGGVWKSYIQLFFQQLATIMIQYICINFALRLAASVTVPTMIGAIVFLIVGFKMPKMLRSILSSGGGGGGTQVMYTAMMVARTFGGA